MRQAWLILTCNSRIITLRLLPCNTTWACDTSSSGTNGAGTVTNDRPAELLPMMTPVLRELLLPLPPCEPLPRTDVARMMRALDRANCRDALVFCFGPEELLEVPAPPPPPPPPPPELEFDRNRINYFDQFAEL